jgi:hypothetical protein
MELWMLRESLLLFLLDEGLVEENGHIGLLELRISGDMGNGRTF